MNIRKFSVSSIVKHVLLLAAVLAVFFPIVILVLNAFKGHEEFGRADLFSLPDSFFYFGNFSEVLQRTQMGRAFLNTGIIIVLSVIGNVAIGTMTAYVLGRFTFRLRKTVLGTFIAVNFIPMITVQIATFTVVQQLGLYNTLFAAIVLHLGADVMQIFIYLQFVKNIPYELDESAMMEGASLFKIYYAIVFPLLMPATVTLIIIKSIKIYNDMFIPYLYMPSQKLGVVSTSLMRFSSERSTEWELLSAAILMIMLPMVVLYLFFQKYVFAGIVTGAVK